MSTRPIPTVNGAYNRRLCVQERVPVFYFNLKHSSQEWNRLFLQPSLHLSLTNTRLPFYWSCIYCWCFVGTESTPSGSIKSWNPYVRALSGRRLSYWIHSFYVMTAWEQKCLGDAWIKFRMKTYIVWVCVSAYLRKKGKHCFLDVTVGMLQSNSFKINPFNFSLIVLIR